MPGRRRELSAAVRLTARSAPASGGEELQAPANRVFYVSPVRCFLLAVRCGFMRPRSKRVRELEDVSVGGPQTILCFRLCPQSLYPDE